MSPTVSFRYANASYQARHDRRQAAEPRGLRRALARPRRARAEAVAMALNKEKVMESARKFAEKGQIDKAIKEYQRLVEEDPTDVRVWLKVGDLYAKRGSKAEAVEAYERSARLYEGQGFSLKAVAVYKQILKLDPALIKINRRLGDLYVQLEMNSEAMQHYEAVSTQLLRDGRGREALEVAKVVVELAPEDIAPRIKLAEQYSKEDLVVDAVREFTVACEQLRKAGRTDDFLKVAERLLWHRPDMIDLTRELATLYMRRKDPRRALAKLQICFKADPQDVAVLNLMAEAFGESEQAPKAVQVLKELARIHEQKGERDLAVSAHRRVLQFDPNDAEAKAYAGAARATSSARPPAPSSTKLASMAPPPEPPPRLNRTGAESLTKDTNLVPEFSLPDYDTKTRSMSGAGTTGAPTARALSRAGSVGVEARAESASETHADQLSKLLSETDVYVKYKLFPKALEHLRRVFSLDPENVEGHERLKDVYLATGREDDALAELLKLAEIFSPSDPERAEQYLRELLTVDAGYQAAHDLARRYRLDLADVPEVELGEDSEFDFDPDDLHTGTVDPETEDVGFEEVLSADLGEVSQSGGLPARVAAQAVSAGSRGRMAMSPAEIEHSIDQQLEAASDFEIDEVPFDRNAAKEFDADLTADEAPVFTKGHDEPTSTGSEPTAQADAAAGGASLEDELEEAEFYEGQGLLEEATNIMRRIAARYPRHPLVRAKLEELGIDLSAAGAAQGSPAPQKPPGPPAATAFTAATVPPGMSPRGPVPSFPAAGGKPAISSRQETATKVSGAPATGPGEFTKPTVMLQKPVEDHDLDTQYDLGLAYKEMGLYDDAIASFQKVLASDYRIGECILMVGMCLRLQGQHRRAIDQLSRGLREQGISSNEQMSLHYELAVAYQELGEAETADALFAEIEEQLPNFADVAKRRAQLRGDRSAQGKGRAMSSTDDAEQALDNLFPDD
ncbi:MAG: tetratricopeptide repeat protein [Myxococcales bacterium]|nr:tetratricopeptide repeat protein [Myxococcales bacterium]